MHDPGPRLANLLLAGYQWMVEAATQGLAERGFDDVRPIHHHAMQAIDAGAVTASDLGRQTSVTKQAALRTISVLIERGWVVREDDPADGRRMRLKVTDLGREVTATGVVVFDEIRLAWEREIGPEALAVFEAQLAALAGPAPDVASAQLE